MGAEVLPQCLLLTGGSRSIPRIVSPSWTTIEEGTVGFVGDRPMDAGEVANTYVDMKGNHKVAIKCHRFYPSSCCLPTYVVLRVRSNL